MLLGEARRETPAQAELRPTAARLADTPIRPYAHTPIRPYAHTPIRPYAHTPLPIPAGVRSQSVLACAPSTYESRNRLSNTRSDCQPMEPL
jgi:hypothetical protein